MFCLQQAFYLEKEMGFCLGRSEILQRTLPSKQIGACYRSHPSRRGFA